jgi:hypothetical protein
VSQGMASSSRLLTRMVGLYGLIHAYEESERLKLAGDSSIELSKVRIMSARNAWNTEE